MEVLVIERHGADVPAEWRALGFTICWVVTVGGESIGFFNSIEEAHWYKQELDIRFAQELEYSSPGMR